MPTKTKKSSYKLSQNMQCSIFSVCSGLVVWLSGNALVAINEVTLRRARLILGWVHHLGM